MTNSQLTLKGKVALITGGARGMGASESNIFAEYGARVFIADVLDDEGSALADAIGEQATYLHLDVSNEANWQQVMDRIEEECDGLDVLVNNAGILKPATLEDTSVDMYMAIFNVNQLGTFLGMRSVIPLMKRRGGGSIINISSSDGLVGTNGLCAYSSSKWAVRGMTKVAAQELGQDGIRVNSVHPGGTKTPMVAGGLDNLEHHVAKMFALYRAAEPEEIANTVLFLASDLSSYTTGTELSVDGGFATTCMNENLPGAPVDKTH